ncbi:NAD-dependent epimerase/dehydratase family protein [[Mycobacterium] burgundiense]|uniref:NAD(P)-dependent oxidoreductase n=1 Tax=[Mycobacterium] burgundiense TaxID=3064286 RepID=A0ABM9LF70_9MYCO|nr:NAD(P)-dependent oxidoreductase [Mycolicibacterium sp. MU0053]CAJ1497906.1 NAD(P)-dependent oxidoreductase [Mycolicibacterium sp. MU0053]
MTVLVTGAFGLVGSATVKQLAADGRRVVASDLDLAANREAAATLPPGVEVRYADLTDAGAVDNLVTAVAPAAIIHLAAIIPPLIYTRRELARRVNVEATGHLLKAAAQQPTPPRFVQASSIAVYGARNPHKITDLLSADTPANPSDLYGAHKWASEQLVRDSDLEWVILRLGGVMTTEVAGMMNFDNLYFEGLLPIDNRLNTVDVRDVARAFAAATTAPAVGETLLIGGDESHRLLQGDVGSAVAAAMGFVGGLPTGLKGNPDSDTDWFATDWMDTSRSQEVLGFQHYSWPDLLIETAEKTGWKRALLRLAAPPAHAFLKRRAPYWRATKPYADPWGAIAAKWGDPSPDRP